MKAMIPAHPVRHARRRLALVALALVALVGATGWNYLFRQDIAQYDDIEDYFLYGSTGTERVDGLPYWIWRVLPDVFANLMPEPGAGYEAFGLVVTDEADMPLGLTRVRIGFDRVGTTCALCHLSVVRDSVGAPQRLYPSGTNVAFDAQRYFNFLFAAVNDARFNADVLMPAIAAAGADLDPIETMLHRHVLIPMVQKQVRAMQNRFSWWYEVPQAGPGRWIAFNDLKYFFAEQPRDGSIGNPDVPPLWNMAPREANGAIHWDGMSDDLWKSTQNAMIAPGGMRVSDVPWDNVRKLVEWWMHQPVPEYPWPVDEALATEGATVWAQNCADCHEIGNPNAGRVIAIDEIGTDPHRYDLLTPATVEAYNNMAWHEYGFDPPQLRKTEGYVAQLLDGVWLRAPYLHNGSVPTLEDLLKPPAERPAQFYRGSDVYDRDRVGYVYEGEGAGSFLYDTTLPGNGNGGHLYGTTLDASQKAALLEYLKTF